jgi:hypothetical protein
LSAIKRDIALGFSEDLLIQSLFKEDTIESKVIFALGLFKACL